MQRITKYRADDGSEWNTKGECAAREAMSAAVEAAMAELKPHPVELNWEGYVQQSKASYRRCRKALFAIVSQEGVLKTWIDGQLQLQSKRELMYCAHPGWFLRMLDGSHTPLLAAYDRLCCIDADMREWNQPYYVYNRGTGVDKRVG